MLPKGEAQTKISGADSVGAQPGSKQECLATDHRQRS
ncbi:hypothetical protein L917_13013 [Phytophthora nicotianae]|uniref:Uncharacterized protein n=1 Tax=Phytophthora nicotianae TaxID=4792 RepID=W2MZK6_PHYNI|nr:hypothetical protein L917_13013 [Phytophthora nicotianae]ETM41098.1 hypothetical protein L914_13103 [Phytophthora nicotianae]